LPLGAGTPPLVLYGPSGMVTLQGVDVLQGATVLHATPTTARVHIARPVVAGQAPAIARRPLVAASHEALQLVHVTVDWPAGSDPWRSSTPPSLPPDVQRRLADQGVQLVLRPGREVPRSALTNAASQPLSVPTPSGQVLLPDIPWLAPSTAATADGGPRFTLRAAGATQRVEQGPSPIQRLLSTPMRAGTASLLEPAQRDFDATLTPSGLGAAPALGQIGRRATEPAYGAGPTPSPRTESLDPPATPGLGFEPASAPVQRTSAAGAEPGLRAAASAAWSPAGGAPPGETVSDDAMSANAWSLQALQRLTGAGIDSLASPHRPLGINVLFYEADGAETGGMPLPGVSPTPAPAWQPLPLQRLSAELAAIGARPAAPMADGQAWDRQAFIFTEDVPEPPPPLDATTVAAAASGRSEASAPAEPAMVTTTVQTAKDHVKEDKHDPPNVDMLARQVYAVIRQRLAVERERTGRRDRW